MKKSFKLFWYQFQLWLAGWCPIHGERKIYVSFMGKICLSCREKERELQAKWNEEAQTRLKKMGEYVRTFKNS